MSLRSYLLMLGLLAFIPAALLITYIDTAWHHTEMDKAKADALELARFVSVSQNQLIQETSKLLITLSKVEGLQSADASLCRSLFADLSGLFGQAYSTFFLADLNGDIVCSGLEPPGPVNISDRDYFNEVKLTGALAFGAYRIGAISGLAVVPMAYPVTDEQGALQSVIVVGVNLSRLNELAALTTMPQGTIVTVFDHNGIVLARYPPAPDWIGKPAPESAHFDAISTQGAGTLRATDEAGELRLYGFTPLEFAPDVLFVSVGILESVVFDKANQALIVGIGGLGIAAALALLGVWFGSDVFLLRKLKALMGVTQRIASGDLQARTGLPHRGSEINRLAQSLDRMAVQLQAHERKLAKQAEELKRSNAELERFAYVASHDLQEPLRMVSSYMQLLEKRYGDALDEKAKGFIAYAVDGASRMQDLINALLVFSRVETQGKTPSPVDGEAVLQQALANLRLLIDKSGANVRHTPLPTITADETQMIQLFQNLISNGIKFRSEAPPELCIGAERQNDHWLFSVKDNGIGIEPEFYDRIFVIFQRLHNKDEYPGTGIGLAICKKIVERHGGNIWVESQSGQGSTFFFTIPTEGVEGA